MTENEAIEILKMFPTWNREDEWLSVAAIEELVNTCNNALEEIQKYRELGKVEFLTDMKSNYVETLSDLRQYRKLGTVEELKEDKAIADELSAIEAAKFYAVISEWKKYQEIGTIEECQENKAIAEETTISGKWIPCSKKLPEKHIDVLVSFNDNNNPTIAWYSEVNKCWKNSSTDNVIKAEVTAWQQLPKPYQEKKGAKHE